MLLAHIYRSVDKMRRRKDVLLRDRLKHERETRDPFRLLDLEIFLLGALESVLRFVIILISDPEHSFKLIYKERAGEERNLAFASHQKFAARARLFSVTTGVVIVASSALVGLALNIVTGVYQAAEAATYTFVQATWAGGATSTAAVHPADRTSWTSYESKDTAFSAGTSLQLSTSASSTIQTDSGSTNTGFNLSGVTHSSTALSGTGASASVQLSSAGRSWATTTVDSTNDTGQETSIAIDSNGKVHISYRFVTSGDLRYATNASGSWVTTTLDSNGNVGSYTSIALDANGKAHISYSDFTNADLKYATNVSGSWVTTTVDFPGFVGDYSSIAIDTNGKAHISYADASNVDLKYATNVSGSWATTTIDSINAVGGYSSIAMDANNKAHISYYDASLSDLKYITNASGSWAKTTVDSSNTVGSYSSIALDANGKVYISYGYTSSADLRYATNVSGSWVITTVDSAGTLGDYTSIAVDTNAKAHISYYYTNAADLRYATNVSGSWATTTVDSAGFAGTYNSIALDSNGLAYISYYDSTGGDLEYAYQRNTYNSSGTYTSGAINLNAVTWGNLSWTQSGGQTITMKARSDADGDFSNATAWSSCTNITNGQALSTGGCVTDGEAYIQYQASLSTADTTVTPSLDDVTIGYNTYPTSASLASSAYDSGDAANIIGSLAWDEDATLPAGTTVTISLRTASAQGELSGASWTDFTNATTNCTKASGTVTCAITAIPAAMKDGSGDRWFQYKVTLTSTGANTPTVDNVTVQYVVNNPPELQNVTATEQSDGTVTISYQTRDSDTLTGTPPLGVITPSFEYSTDGGLNWTPINTNLADGATSTKVVDQVTWNTYSTTWTARNTLSGTATTTAQIRVTARDNEAANNSASFASSNFTLDLKNPILGSVPVRVQGNYTPALITLDVTDDSTMQMRVGFSPDLADASWIAHASSTTLTLVDDPETVYAQFRDPYANQTAIQAVQTPTKPSNMVNRDLSNISATPPDYRLFVSWNVVPAPGPGFANYRVYRSTDGSTYSLVTSIANRLTNYYLDTENGAGLDPNLTYRYKVYAEDTNDNTSYYSSIVQDQPNGQGGTDTTPPMITGVSTTTTTQSATVNWTTDELSDSTVGYCAAPCSDFSTTRGVASYVTNHEVVLSGLTAGQSYNFQVSSRDPAGNLATSSALGFTTNPGPSISGVATIRVSNASADIGWNTDIAASSYVAYATNTPPTGGVESVTGAEALTTNHLVSMPALTAGQRYYYYVKSQDGSGNWAYDYNIVGGVKEYYTFTTSNDVTAPVISSVATTTVTENAAVISWLTDEVADSQVHYGTVSGSYASSSVRATYDMTHYVELTGLASTTLYYYVVSSADQNGNRSTSTERSFRTLEEQFGVSERLSQNTTQTVELVSVRYVSTGVDQSMYESLKRDLDLLKAVLAQKTEELSNKTKELAAKAAELATALSDLSTIRSEVLGLKEDDTTDPKDILRVVTEKFESLTKIFERDAALDITESDLAPAMKTLRDLAEAVPPPVMKGAPMVDISPEEVAIRWTTDKETNSVIAFAKRGDYDPAKEDPYVEQSGIYDVYEKDHRIVLRNLLPSTEYHFQVRSASSLGISAKTRDYTFKTAAQMPEIIEARLERVSDASVRVAWRTNILTNSLVRYTPMKNGKPDEKNSATFGKPDFETAHSILLDKLLPATTYQAEIISMDPHGNSAQRDLATFTTGKDVTPPEISRVRTEIAIFPGAQAKIQAIVFWTTNELASSQVFFESGLKTGEHAETPTEATAQTTDMSLEHTVVITSWKPETVYRLRVVSVDASGNVGTSTDYTVKTPQRKASIIDIISKNFSTTFSWTKNVGF